jgi:hypothetical protein
MRFMLIVKASRDSEAGVMPSKKLMEDMGAFNQEMIEAGVLLAGEGLHASSKGARVRFPGASRTVTRGPFEARDLIAGFWLIQAKSLDEAIEWAKRSPAPHETEDCEIEIRQLFEAEDFPAEVLSPELAAREQEFRDRLQR